MVNITWILLFLTSMNISMSFLATLCNLQKTLTTLQQLKNETYLYYLHSVIVVLQKIQNEFYALLYIETKFNFQAFNNWQIFFS